MTTKNAQQPGLLAAPSCSAAYHPDPAINAEVEADAVQSEIADLAAGFPPSWWMCPGCGASHDRGWFGTPGSHRCLNCGHTGGGGVMARTREELHQQNAEAQQP